MSSISEELKNITTTTSILKISSVLEKVYKKIDEDLKKEPLQKIKEIELLKLQCKSENIHLSLMSCSTFVKLVENSNLDAVYVMTTFLIMLPNSSSGQKSVITEGIINLLLLNLKRKILTLKPDEKFECQFDLKTPQHPIIAICQTDGVNMMDITNKISGIYNHYDQQIQTYSLEYLRPVFLYLFCNPQTQAQSKPIWTGLLELNRKNPDVKNLLNEIISWSKINSSSTCLYTTILLIEAINHFEANSDYIETNELIIYLAHIINQQLKFGLDPRPSLQCIQQCLHSATKDSIKYHYNILLIILNETLHQIPPIYLPELFRIIFFIIVTENYGNQFILNMILDGIIQWMANISFIKPEGVAIAMQIIIKITHAISIKNDNWNTEISNDYKNSIVRNFDSNIGIAFNISRLSESFDQSEYKNIFTFVDNINRKFTLKKPIKFYDRIQLFLRGLFLSKEPSIDCWFKIYQAILITIKKDENMSYDFLMTYIYKLSNETNPEVQLELLRGLPSFAVLKDNIPMILNTIKALTTGINATFCMDLYLRLWKQEIRTYPFLIKFLSQPNKDKIQPWQYNLAKAHTIREICIERPSQNGTDLVSHLSDILNNCSGEDGDLETSIALDGIVALCENNTVNITSTWKVLCVQFRHEKRPKSLKSLYNFFGHIPLLQSQTKEYDHLVIEGIEHLWNVIANSKSPDLIREALKNLIHYQVTGLMTLQNIPEKFKENLRKIEIDDHIPGECWVELIQKIHPDCKLDAADLISQFIYEEIKSYRSAIYYLPDNRPEPRKLQGLFSKSPLRAIVSYLVSQSRFGEQVGDVGSIIACLRAISKKFTKPIPPLDWCFLHSLFHLDFYARKYCLLIAKNQIHNSGTARRILENFLVEFEPNCFEEDLLLLFRILPEFVTGISLNILKNFAEKTALYCFKESQLNGFPEGCLFEKFLYSVRSVFTSKCDVQEILDIFTLIVERYMDSMDLDSRLFERYTEVVATLQSNSIDDLTSPANWWEIPIGKLKKATIIRCYLVLYNTQLDNPLTWLNPIIDAFVNQTNEQLFLFRHLAATFFAFNDEKNACNWIMDLFRQIQTVLADSPVKEKLNHLELLLDIFVLAIDAFSNVAVLFGNFDLLATSRDLRIEIFPESVQVLCDELFWKDNELKIYEFLFSLYKNAYVPVHFCEMFKSAIICSRNRPYFDSKGIWTKFVGMRK